jgi:hypothetical protein
MGGCHIKSFATNAPFLRVSRTQQFRSVCLADGDDGNDVVSWHGMILYCNNAAAAAAEVRRCVGCIRMPAAVALGESRCRWK